MSKEREIGYDYDEDRESRKLLRAQKKLRASMPAGKVWVWKTGNTPLTDKPGESASTWQEEGGSRVFVGTPEKECGFQGYVSEEKLISGLAESGG